NRPHLLHELPARAIEAGSFHLGAAIACRPFVVLDGRALSSPYLVPAANAIKPETPHAVQ
ncbi:MAG TPA: hypothetical protein PKD04_08865, partial [Rhodocyclaceae bacterium]|nr:hypothetical protein [Rhodocyclaceae bacterium]